MSSPAPLLQAFALSRHYTVSRGLLRRKGLVRALDGVAFSLRAGETLAVVGESGCGKSTLARQVTMIERPTGGELKVNGEDVAHAELFDEGHHLLLRSGSDRKHRHHGRHAENHSQHGQQ